VIITAYQDRSFTFELKLPPVSYFVKEAAGIKSGSQTPGKGAKAGKITIEQIREIATKKLPDLNCDSVEAAMAMVKGSAQSMGLEIVG
jgi:large subunit ribosomal protein L11